MTSQAPSIFMRAFVKYDRLLTVHTFKTAAVTNMILCSIGDTVAQYYNNYM